MLVHNAGHMVTGPAEAFTPEQLADLYDTNVLGTQRLNRAALPHLREQGDGLVLWVGSSSTRGGTPPYLGPVLRGEGRDGRAGPELRRWSSRGSGSRPPSSCPARSPTAPTTSPTAAAGRRGRRRGLRDEVRRTDGPGRQKLAELEPEWADVAEVAEAIVTVVGTEKGPRPFRVHIDPSDDGAAVVNAVADRVRAEFLRRVGLDDLLHPTA